jgi:hypothetical protein
MAGIPEKCICHGADGNTEIVKISNTQLPVFHVTSFEYKLDYCLCGVNLIGV